MICANTFEVYLVQRSPGIPFVYAKEQMKSILTPSSGVARLLSGIQVRQTGFKLGKVIEKARTISLYKTQQRPFRSGFLPDASAPEPFQSLLPALYRTNKGDLKPSSPGDLTYLEEELGVGRLHKLTDWLWIAGRPMPPRPLHHQLLLGREIVIAERMDLHLVWSSGRIFL
ncbi:hypothetical protein DL766_007769 [Monosporascus sp. MC13-8B]|uniref:Uncharacterized protein n=1 Tax=Monosporascus cannonballus TaxID=155416 RepID=A0ABY0HCV7_9PEZI|nr:hypothetical protein DL762_002675 [Monosporascus cannonballus]RYO95438.1 hypothetical protein DL763_003702 [Monosporascus cannonballus]RYP22153.1 hypothetical protein DL766_007769 [Monosporascus sp. MC13-8B]